MSFINFVELPVNLTPLLSKSSNISSFVNLSTFFLSVFFFFLNSNETFLDFLFFDDDDDGDDDNDDNNDDFFLLDDFFLDNFFFLDFLFILNIGCSTVSMIFTFFKSLGLVSDLISDLISESDRPIYAALKAASLGDQNA